MFGTQLTATQAQNRLRRKHSASRGKMQKPGTRPTIYKAVDKAVFMPMQYIPSFAEIMAGLQLLMFHRKKRSRYEKEMGKN